jgi:hypothetical protein
MSELVGDCLRCKTTRITFNLISAIFIRREVYGWQNWYEAFCICRHCHRATVFVLSESVDGNYRYLHDTGLVQIQSAVNQFVKIEGRVTLKDNSTIEPPEHIPEQVEAVFREGATCLAVQCFNAAGTMFRLCIDLVTKSLLPAEEAVGLNHRTRRDLGLRIPWRFENGILPEALRELSTCVREDGNDGAHAGNLSNDDAIDLLEFTTLLLERIYTEPERLRLAQERRQQRRSDA